MILMQPLSTEVQFLWSLTLDLVPVVAPAVMVEGATVPLTVILPVRDISCVATLLISKTD
tara:strand:- start:903 stop:1082 length:180 start_codon:yes stop_codon:yes gene_type:complete